MLLFAGTAITLNHAALFEPPPKVTTRTAILPPPLVAGLAGGPQDAAAPLPDNLAAWVRERFQVNPGRLRAEWSPDEVVLTISRPGGERTLSLDRETGQARLENASRGLVGALNDLHTGRNSGPAWGLFIDAFAVSCLVFAVTGFAMGLLYAPGRPLTWPLLAAGLAAPLLLALAAFAHLL